MTEPLLPSDPLWPRAAHWFVPATDAAAATTYIQFASIPQNTYLGGELICTVW